MADSKPEGAAAALPDLGRLSVGAEASGGGDEAKASLRNTRPTLANDSSIRGSEEDAIGGGRGDGSGAGGRIETVNYEAQREIGRGSFGSVYLARIVETDEVVAIKKVLQDRRFKNRELQIMRQLARQPHPYIVSLRHHFISKGTKEGDVYLNLVLDLVPETIYSVTKQYGRAKELVPILSVKTYMYQLARALAHIHGMGICHRDIKPQNLLVDPVRQVLKLCDFGSAKCLVAGEPNVAYICSRYYRAPELIFGASDYTSAIDVWSQGCVLAELLLGNPIFPGTSAVDQLVEIVRVLGTPSKEEVKSMNQNYQDYKSFPVVRPPSWNSIFKAGTSPESMDLCAKLLTYIPTKRYKAIEACGHPFFNELRDPATRLIDEGNKLFELTQEELSLNPEMAEVLIPPHARRGGTAGAEGGGGGGGGEAGIKALDV